MTFSDLCRLLYPFLKGRCKNMAELFDLLILGSMRPESEGVKEEIAQMTARQKRNLCEGIYSISKISQKVYPFLDTTSLSEILTNEIKGFAIDEFIETFSLYDEDINKSNFAEKTSEKLREIILDNSSLFRSAQLEGTATLRSELFQEDEGICPGCGCKLDLDSSKDNAIVAIGLDGLSPRGLTKAIGLCRRCAEKLRNNQFEKDIVKMKVALEEKSALKKEVGSIDINEKLMMAIDRLLRRSDTSKVRLSMKSLRIDQKIDKKSDFVFYAKVRTNVTAYFSVLFDMFGKLDGEEQRSYELLSSSIKIACIKAEGSSQNKEAVFNCLVDQVANAASCEKSVAEIIVSYFVQSCEVFHEISE